MGRAFDGTTQCAGISVDLSAYSVATFAGVFYGDSFTSGTNVPFFEYGNPNWTVGGCLLDPNAGPGAITLIGFSNAAGTLQWTDSFPTAPAVKYVHYCVAYDRAAKVNLAWVDGVPQTLTPVGHAAGAYGNFANARWNLMARNFPAPSLFQKGRCAELAVWGGVSLGNTEAAALAVGVPPWTIRPANLITYVPMGQASPDPDYVQGHNPASITGATVDQHISPMWLGTPPRG